MKRVILILSALSTAVSMTATAETLTPNCDSLNIMLMSMEDGLDINANWKTPGSAPDKFKTISMGDLNKPGNPSFKITCPNLTAEYNGNALKIKSDSYDNIVKHLYKQLNRGVDLYNYRWYADNKLKKELKVNKYSFDLERLLLTDGYIKMPEGSAVSNTQSFIPNTATISYKINGGELQSLLKNKTVNKYSTDFNAAKTIDIYHKNPNLGRKGFGVERIFVDKDKAVLEIYKDYEYPTQ